MSPPLIEARQLKKNYGSFEAVRGISFQVNQGECFGFLGPNGAGKSTTMRMMYGLTKPSSGELRLFDLDIETNIREIKRKLGVVPQDISLDPDLTVFENLIIYGRYFDVKGSESKARAEKLLTEFHLESKKSEKIDQLSGGMKRRLLIARALMSRPELMILDEPTTGLDPQSRHMLWDKIRDFKKNGLTVILTTHYMEEAEQLCDRLMIVDFGQVIAEGKPADLIREHGVADLEALFIKLTGKHLRDT